MYGLKKRRFFSDKNQVVLSKTTTALQRQQLREKQERKALLLATIEVFCWLLWRLSAPLSKTLAPQLPCQERERGDEVALRARQAPLLGRPFEALACLEQTEPELLLSSPCPPPSAGCPTKQLLGQWPALF